MYILNFLDCLVINITHIYMYLLTFILIYIYPEVKVSRNAQEHSSGAHQLSRIINYTRRGRACKRLQII